MVGGSLSLEAFRQKKIKMLRPSRALYVKDKFHKWAGGPCLTPENEGAPHLAFEMWDFGSTSESRMIVVLS
jgi:hypothetical protein